MRIALLPSAYHPAIGGVETLTANLAATLAGRGHHVEVWTYGGERADDDDDVVGGIPVRRFDFVLPTTAIAGAGATARRAAVTARRLRAARRAFRPDLLHVQCFSGNGVWALATAATGRLPLVVTMQGETVMDDNDVYRHSVQLRAALRVALRRADAVTGCSRFTIEHAEGLVGRRRPDAEVVWNATDLERDHPEPLPEPLPFERYVAAVGRVVAKKGFDLLVDAFASLSPDRPDVGLVVAGRGESVGDLRRQAVRLGVADRVHLPGPLLPGQVATLMASAAAVVVPSRVEPFGIVALEGWRSGRPTIVTSRGGPPEFVRHGVDGLVVDPFDRDALAGAIASVLDDPVLADRIGAAGRARLDEFTWPVITDRYEEIYRRVLAGRGHPCER